MSTITLGTAKGIRTIGGLGGDAAADPLGGADVTTLALAEDGALWALVAHREVHRIVGGKAERVATVEGPMAWCLLVRRGTVWVGTEEAGLYRLGERGLERVRSFDGAPSHREWYGPGGEQATTWTMDSDAERLYVNVHVGGILRSADEGRSWTPTIDLHADVHQVSVGDDGRLWAATGKQALVESRDAGASWKIHRDALHAEYLTCALPTPEGVLVVAGSQYGAKDFAVYRFDGQKFEPCAGLPERFRRDVDARRLAARGQLAALAGVDGRLYVSEDAGRAWKIVAEDLPDTRAVVIS